MTVRGGLRFAFADGPAAKPASSTILARFAFGRFARRFRGLWLVALRRRCRGRLAAPRNPPARARSASNNTSICVRRV